MSDQQQPVWPDGARDAVMDAKVAHELRPYREEVDAILTAMEPFVQQRIEQGAASIRHLINDAHDDGYADGLRDGAAADVNVFRAALDEIDEQVPPAIGIYQTIPDRVRLVIAQRDEAESIVAALRAEVARLREDGELLDWMSGILQGNDPELGKTIGDIDLRGSWEVVALEVPNTCAVQAPNLRAAIDAARSARGGEG